MTKKPLVLLPYPSTAAMQGPRLVHRGSSVTLSMTCDDEGQERATGVRFVKPRAVRQRTETYCTTWHIAEVYDTVCEVEGSDWVAELRNDATPEWRDSWVMRHFMIYVDGFGCLEVIAESALLID